MTNYAAMGYALLAADKIKLTEKQKERLWNVMYMLMDEKTEEEAEKRFMHGT